MTSFNGSWTHQISPRTTLGVGGGYTLTDYQTTPSGTEHFVSATAGASYLLTDAVDRRALFVLRSHIKFAGRKKLHG